MTVQAWGVFRGHQLVSTAKGMTSRHAIQQCVLLNAYHPWGAYRTALLPNQVVEAGSNHGMVGTIEESDSNP